MRIRLALVVLTAGLGCSKATPPERSGTSQDCAAPGTCKPACDRGDLGACTWLGMFHISDTAAVRDALNTKRGIPLLEKACDGGDAEGCIALTKALLLESQLTHAPLDEARVTALRDRACKAGNGRGCDDPLAAIAALDRQCTAGEPQACFLIIDAYDQSVDTSTSTEPNIPSLSERIRGAISNHSPVKPDPVKAKALRDRGVALVDAACTQGRARMCQTAIPHEITDHEAMARHEERACKAGASAACISRGYRAAPLGNPAGADALAVFVDALTKACDLGDYHGCRGIAQRFEAGEDGIAKDAAKARSWWARACDAGDDEGCRNAHKTPS